MVPQPHTVMYGYTTRHGKTAVLPRLMAFVERQEGVRVRWKKPGGFRDLRNEDLGSSRGWMVRRSALTSRSRLEFHSKPRRTARAASSVGE